jgi:MFS family permease
MGQFGDGLLQSALATFVLFSPERAPTAATVAASFAILLLPYSVIGPFAGVLLDRWSRRQVLVRANILKGLLVVPVIAAFLTANDGPLLGLFVLMVLGVGRFILAGLSASLPHVVDEGNLVTANAFTPTSGTIAAAIGGGIGVGIRALAGGGDSGGVVVLVTAIICYLTASTIAVCIRVRRLGPDGLRSRDTVAGVLRGLRDGASELRSQTPASHGIGLVMAHRFEFGALTVAALLFLRNTYASDVDQAIVLFGVATGAAAVGAFIGAVVTPRMVRRIGYRTWPSIIAVQSAVIGVPLVILAGAFTNLGLLLAGAVSIGLGGQSVKVSADTLVQEMIPDDYRGRVFALFDMANNVGLVTGVTVVAFLAPASGVAPVVYSGVAVVLLIVVGWYARSARTWKLPAP